MKIHSFSLDQNLGFLFLLVVSLNIICKEIVSWHSNLPLPVAVCTVLDSWWWTEKLSETCRVLFLKQIWEISAFLGFNIRIYHDVQSSECQICNSVLLVFYMFRTSYVQNQEDCILHAAWGTSSSLTDCLQKCMNICIPYKAACKI